MNIEIYCNYGCLSAEKMNVYTYDAPEATAVTYDKLSVTIPDGWKTWHGGMGELFLEAPWGTRYEVSEVLYSMRRNGVDFPCFKAYDKDGRYHIQRLTVVETPNEELDLPSEATAKQKSDTIKSTYNISFKKNNVYQTNLCVAETAEQARAYFEYINPEAEIIGVSINNESFKPGKPCHTVPDGWSSPVSHEPKIRESCDAKQVAVRHKQTAKKRGPKI